MRPLSRLCPCPGTFTTFPRPVRVFSQTAPKLQPSSAMHWERSRYAFVMSGSLVVRVVCGVFLRAGLIPFHPAFGVLHGVEQAGVHAHRSRPFWRLWSIRSSISSGKAPLCWELGCRLSVVPQGQMNVVYFISDHDLDRLGMAEGDKPFGFSWQTRRVCLVP